MSMLKLADISKAYRAGNLSIPALKGVSLEFRKNEFVSILGPSGCGKTTLLNVIGGLDHYDSGDLIINGLSTKRFGDSDWDAYRNRSIGFIFQNYNLISHQTVLQNVEISLTLSGISPGERKRRAVEALTAVGLADQLRKKPSQMSGGQMQRVAVARALVGNPDIILADEPTGALDSHTSVQLMEILKEIAKTRLVIMVTHNAELAEQYSTRIIRLLDGEIQSDTSPIAQEAEPEAPAAAKNGRKIKKTSMSYFTAISLSFKNLLTKKGRTIITSFAGSIGIIGVALVLALSGGLTGYMDSMQSDVLSGFPLMIGTYEQSVTGDPAIMVNGQMVTAAIGGEKYPSGDVLYSHDPLSGVKMHTNILTDEYLGYISGLEAALPGAVNNISYTSAVGMNLLAKWDETVVKYDTAGMGDGMGMGGGMASMLGLSGTYWQEMPNNHDFILSLYDLVGEGSRMASEPGEIMLVVDEYNRIDKSFFEKLGIGGDAENLRLTDFIGRTVFKVVPNDSFYSETDGVFTAASPAMYGELYDADGGITLTVTGILRLRDDATTGYLSQGFIYTPALTGYVLGDASASQIALAQSATDSDVLTGVPFKSGDMKKLRFLSLGADTAPTGIDIYPRDFESKDKIKTYLDAYNADKKSEDEVIYLDMAEQITAITGTLLSAVTLVLIGFASISLIVSSIMIGIITYVSVLERTKEIGILRSVGARKKDISRVFSAETIIVGFTAGLIGVGLAYLLSIPINGAIYDMASIRNIADLSPLNAIFLIGGSIALTLIAGFLPSKMAAKKDPVEALRSE